MKKAKNKTTTTVGAMIVISLMILLFYGYWTNRKEPLEDASLKNLSEVEKILNEDLEEYYPETPREVMKLFGRIYKALYGNAKDDEIKPLAMKLRELCGEEFLQNNPEEDYLNNISTELAEWRKKDRKITNYVLTKEDLEEDGEIDGVKYAGRYISFTIQENVKFTETWRVLLRQEEDKRWKVVYWEFVAPEEKKD